MLEISGHIKWTSESVKNVEVKSAYSWRKLPYIFIMKIYCNNQLFVKAGGQINQSTPNLTQEPKHSSAFIWGRRSGILWERRTEKVTI